MDAPLTPVKFGTVGAPAGSPDNRRPPDAVTTVSVQRALEWAQEEELLAELSVRYPWMVFLGLRQAPKAPDRSWERFVRWYGDPATALGLLQLATYKVTNAGLGGTPPVDPD